MRSGRDLNTRPNATRPAALGVLVHANVQDGELTLLEHIHGPVLDALARGPATLAELVKVPALEPLGWEAVVC